MSIALKLGTDGNLQKIGPAESLQADLFERLSASGNLLVGSLLGASDELRLGSSAAITRSMGGLVSDTYLKVGGTAGPRFGNNAGVLEASDTAGTSRAVVRVGQPAGDNASDAETAGDFLLKNYPVYPNNTYSNTWVSGRITQEVWRRTADSSLLKQIDYTYTGSRVTTEVRRVYAANGSTVIAQLTNVYTYTASRLTGQTTVRNV